MPKMTAELAAATIRRYASRKMTDEDFLEEVGWIMLRYREGV